MRKSKIIVKNDNSGEFEIEIFEGTGNEYAIVCAHGSGVRRWDGKDFYKYLAEDIPSADFYLVDQCQIVEDGCKLNEFDVMVNRVQIILDMAIKSNKEVILLGHSLGCVVVSSLKIDGVSKLFMVFPAAGSPVKSLKSRYGLDDISEDFTAKTKNGHLKIYSKEYYKSIKDLVYKDRYKSLIDTSNIPIYVYEAENEEIVSEERFEIRDWPWTSYQIAPNAKHDLIGDAYQWFLKDFRLKTGIK